MVAMALFCRSTYRARSKDGLSVRPLDLGMPGAADRTLHGVGQRDVLKLLRDYVTVLVGPIEKLDDVDAARDILRILGQLDEGSGHDGPAIVARQIDQAYRVILCVRPIAGRRGRR